MDYVNPHPYEVEIPTPQGDLVVPPHGKVKDGKVVGPRGGEKETKVVGPSPEEAPHGDVKADVADDSEKEGK